MLFLRTASKSDLTGVAKLRSKWSDKWTSEPEEYTPVVKPLANIFVGLTKKISGRYFLVFRLCVPHYCDCRRAALSASSFVQLYTVRVQVMGRPTRSPNSTTAPTNASNSIGRPASRSCNIEVLCSPT